MRTQEEKQEAVKRLEENKQVAPITSFFGDDNHAKIDIYIDVINGVVDDAAFEDENDIMTANDAIAWLNGECELEDLLFE